MKRTLLISLILFIFTAVTLKAQYVYPPQQKIYTYTDTTYTTKDSIYISASLPQFKINNFILGWHWAMGKKMTESLGFNQSHIGDVNSFNSVDSVAGTINVIKNSTGVYSNGNHLRAMNTIAMQWEPTLHINEDSLKELQFRTYDKDRSVFGFRTILGEPLVTNPTDSNYQSLLLKTTGNYVGQLVLTNPWSDSSIYRFNKDVKSDSSYFKYYGYDFVFSINLRRNDIRNNTQDNTPVLSIKLPYKIGTGGLNYIIFSEIPTNIANDFDNITNIEIARGKKHKVILDLSGPDSLIITRNMLPTNNSEITISAYFQCRGGMSANDILDFSNNIYPKLGCDIRYLGGCNIAIDWVRIGSEASEDVYWGNYDSLLIADTQRDFDFMNSQEFIDQKSYIKRFYLRDEGNCSFWKSAKYYNDLIGNIGTFEVGPELPDLYKHYVNPPEYWYSFYKLYSNTAAPFVRNGWGANQSDLNIALYGGFRLGTHWENDSLNSGFETIGEYGGNNFFNPNVPFNQYVSQLKIIGSIQAQFENYVTYNYLLENRKNFLFQDINWWAQSFIYAKSPKMFTPTGFPTLKDTILTFESRAKTAHELSLFIWQPIILGGKGILFDGEVSSNAITTPMDERRIATNIGKNQYFYENCYLSPSTRLVDLNSWDFLLHDSVGTDFLNPNYEWSGIHRFIDWDVVPSNLGISQNRLYVGRKSNRIELKNSTDFVQNNESKLMSLKLQAWLGKGYRQNYLQHPAYTQDTIMSSFLGLNEQGIKTRPIGRVNSSGEPYYEDEAIHQNGWKIDSSFYDITILADSNITQSTSLIYVGMLNRRTSPLIHIDPEVDQNEQNEHLLFLSLAEINELCENGGVNPESNVYKTAEEWRTLYWKRAACREITIPFNYCDPENPNDYVLLRVQELKADENYDESWPWWRKERSANFSIFSRA